MEIVVGGAQALPLLQRPWLIYRDAMIMWEINKDIIVIFLVYSYNII